MSRFSRAIHEPHTVPGERSRFGAGTRHSGDRPMSERRRHHAHHSMRHRHYRRARSGAGPGRAGGGGGEDVSGTIGAATVDNLRVPHGATCTLNGTRVKGTVKVERAATLRATGIAVVGNVQAENAARVAGHRPGRRVLPGRAGRLRDLSSTVKGDVLLDANRRELGVSRTRSAAASRCSRTPAEPRSAQHGQRQPAVQGERPAADRWRQRGPGQQGGSVRAAVAATRPPR